MVVPARYSGRGVVASLLLVFLLVAGLAGVSAQRSRRPQRLDSLDRHFSQSSQSANNNMTGLDLPEFSVGTTLSIEPFVPGDYTGRVVDERFIEAHIATNTVMTPPVGDPIFTVHHVYWGYIQDESFGKNVLVAEIAGVDVMEYSLYLLQFTDQGELVSTLCVARHAAFSDSAIQLGSRVKEGRIDTTYQSLFFHHDVPPHLNPVVERSYKVGRSQGGSYEEIVTGNYYMPNPHGIGLSRAMESEFFSAWETQRERPRMFLIGWSRGGYMAYILESFQDGMGAVFYTWHIFDIASNRMVWNRRDNEEDALKRISSSPYRIQSPEAFMEYYQKSIRTLAPVLQEFGIITHTEAEFTPLLPGRWYIEGEEVAVRVINETRSFHPDFGIERITSYDMVIQREDRERRVFAQKDMEGLVLGIRPIGRILYPHDPEKAVIVSAQVLRGWEGPPHGIGLQVNGVRTDF
ncbi:hypothetical protein AU468_06005 [Alkalispirochaeta sphaeroplastigenens]|uniref:Uncharacterized protein n=1 Tax=Alkalispirochaeta sphaeroplastigenens TaxID=1187066 RepID=A0A2S4JUE0_9SPIO|nr:hypothetical protein [Alkalispirochaeta sphaeroplastigenens]POR03103.1 hypothetical protein AU468_06005 [Alkalispirochaeta sphaeroplastigenens]